MPTTDPPIFWIVAGPNGSGKSTLYEGSALEEFGRFWIINPDQLAARIRAAEGLEPDPANIAAVNRIEDWLHRSIQAYQSVGVETVLSTDKYRTLVTEAKERGYEFRFIYVVLRSADQNVERVRLRVAGGGHDVEESKIRGRRERSLEQLSWFLEQADTALIFDNSTAQPILVARKRDGIVTLDPRAPADIKRVAAKISD